jgi:MFS transporter, DHA2 family, multidrug resistance protein
VSAASIAAIGVTPASAAVAQDPPIPWLGIAAVLLGTFISTLTGRLSTFGLGDIRGAVHAGFDEGAWITTSQTTAQMLITPIAVWAGSIYGPRRVLLLACGAFAVASLAIPWSPNLATLLGLQFVSGLGSGCFMPLTLSFILGRLPRKFWPYGIALYALHIDFSLNISASLEGWYIEHGSWRWIFWQNVPLAAGMAACLYFGIRPAPAPASPSAPSAPRKIDLFGLAASGVGLALVYAALDQGNRLDWQNSGLVWGLILGGVILLIAFGFHATRSPNSWINLRVAFSYPLPVVLVLVTILRSSLLTTAFLIPQFLGVVRGFHALQIGDTLLWVAVPQLLLFPLAGHLLRYVDPRVPGLVGLSLIGVAGLMVARGLTPQWGSDQFLLSQLIQALGQSLAMTGVIYTTVLNMRMDIALTFGALLQITRLLGGELGTAFVTTFHRIREQRASNLIGAHIQSGAEDVLHRLQAYGHVVARSGHLDPDGSAATSVLGRVVHGAATTQAVIDGFAALGVTVMIGLFALSMLRLPAEAAPHPPESKG